MLSSKQRQPYDDLMAAFASILAFLTILGPLVVKGNVPCTTCDDCPTTVINVPAFQQTEFKTTCNDESSLITPTVSSVRVASTGASKGEFKLAVMDETNYGLYTESAPFYSFEILGTGLGNADPSYTCFDSGRITYRVTTSKSVYAVVSCLSPVTCQIQYKIDICPCATVNCGDNGKCTGNGRCVCSAGFNGPVCQYKNALATKAPGNSTPVGSKSSGGSNIGLIIGLVVAGIIVVAIVVVVVVVVIYKRKTSGNQTLVNE